MDAKNGKKEYQTPGVEEIKNLKPDENVMAGCKIGTNFGPATTGCQVDQTFCSSIDS
ncbi:hypothetical protein GF324_13655 [bacterium]|nr:hypothetical protein [bacterium]